MGQREYEHRSYKMVCTNHIASKGDKPLWCGTRRITFKIFLIFLILRYFYYLGSILIVIFAVIGRFYSLFSQYSSRAFLCAYKASCTVSEGGSWMIIRYHQLNEDFVWSLWEVDLPLCLSALVDSTAVIPSWIWGYISSFLTYPILHQFWQQSHIRSQPWKNHWAKKKKTIAAVQATKNKHLLLLQFQNFNDLCLKDMMPLFNVSNSIVLLLSFFFQLRHYNWSSGKQILDNKTE